MPPRIAGGTEDRIKKSLNALQQDETALANGSEQTHVGVPADGFIRIR